MLPAHEIPESLAPARPLTVGVRSPHVTKKLDDRPAGRMTLLARDPSTTPAPELAAGGVSPR
jgi:hypothetical protein